MPRNRNLTLSRPDFVLTDTDKKILEHTAGDLDAFCRWFFDITPIPWQT